MELKGLISAGNEWFLEIAFPSHPTIMGNPQCETEDFGWGETSRERGIFRAIVEE